MMNDNYLIPANSKKSLLIFGLFKKDELIMFGVCLGITLLALMTLPIRSTWVALLALAPALIAGFLVMPVPNYHNILTVITGAYQFFTNNQQYKWKGWCFLDGEEKKSIHK